MGNPMPAAVTAAPLPATQQEYEDREPRKGKWCRVVRGRKVPVGTEGWCIWTGMSDYGARVGIKDTAGVVHWTAASNAERCPAPAEQQAAADAERADYLARRAALPVCVVRKGAVVQVVRGKLAGQAGKVFWVGEGRDGAPRYGVSFGATKDFVSGRDVEAAAPPTPRQRRRHVQTECPSCGSPSTLGLYCDACCAAEAASEDR